MVYSFMPPPLPLFSLISSVLHFMGSVGAAHKVCPLGNWSQETMTCHSFNFFSIVWDQG